MNRELLERWIHDPDLSVLSQDEDLILGTGENLELLEEFLQRRDALAGKRVIILSAICVILYDNSPSVDDRKDSGDLALAARATKVLRQNLAAFDEINEDFICDYIKEVVYPIIGRPFKALT